VVQTYVRGWKPDGASALVTVGHATANTIVPAQHALGVIQPILGESDGAAMAYTAGATFNNSIGMKFVLIRPGEVTCGQLPVCSWP